MRTWFDDFSGGGSAVTATPSQVVKKGVMFDKGTTPRDMVGVAGSVYLSTEHKNRIKARILELISTHELTAEEVHAIVAIDPDYSLKTEDGKQQLSLHTFKTWVCRLRKQHGISAPARRPRARKENKHVSKE